MSVLSMHPRVRAIRTLNPHSSLINPALDRKRDITTPIRPAPGAPLLPALVWRRIREFSGHVTPPHRSDERRVAYGADESSRERSDVRNDSSRFDSVRMQSSHARFTPRSTNSLSFPRLVRPRKRSCPVRANTTRRKSRTTSQTYAHCPAGPQYQSQSISLMTLFEAVQH